MSELRRCCVCRHTMWNADVACLFASMPVCADCLDKARIWERIGLSIQRAARRAEVAGLVETLDRAVDVMADPASDYAYDDARDKFAIARDRLARLAGGGA